MKKKIERYFPKAFLDSLEYLRALSKYVRINKVLKRNLSFKGRYNGESVYVIGNGPSLNNYDLNKIKNKYAITMNHFELHPLRNNFHIVAHCIGEQYESKTWEEPVGMLSGISADAFWFNADAVKYFKGKQWSNIHYYLPGVSPLANLISGADISKVALNYQSTSQMAINIAIYLGFNNVFLLGFDHDWLVTRGHSPHFYEEQEGIDVADFSKYSYLEMIEISKSLFETYYKLKKNADKYSTKIWNLSDPSYLDVFPKLDCQN